MKQKEYENYMGLKKYFTVTKKFPWWSIENIADGLMYLTAVTGWSDCVECFKSLL